jgi:HAD domain in Swiss Army Knife RNA repair proteins
MRPIVLLDVDGPLNPWAANSASRPPGYVEHRFRLRRWSRRKPLHMWLNPRHGVELSRLAQRSGAELVWATTWEHQANTMIGRALGLPVLPVIEVGAFLEPRPGQEFTWKYGPVGRYAAGRPLAWFDDDFDVYPAARDAFLDRRRSAGLSTELIGVDPRTGLTEIHFAALTTWISSL